MIRAGQFKYKFGLEQSTPDADLEFINKSEIVSKYLAVTRDIGVEMSKKIPIKKIDSNLAIACVNGSGSNQPEDNTRKTLIGRFTAMPAGCLSIGGSVYDGTVGSANTTKRGIGGEMKYEYKKM